jgi:hypothetical protein
MVQLVAGGVRYTLIIDDDDDDNDTTALMKLHYRVHKSPPPNPI